MAKITKFAKKRPVKVQTAWTYASVIRGEHSGHIAVGETYTALVSKFENGEGWLGVQAANGALLWVPSVFFENGGK